MMHSVAESINLQHEEQAEKHHALEKAQQDRIKQLEQQLREAGITPVVATLPVAGNTNSLDLSLDKSADHTITHPINGSNQIVLQHSRNNSTDDTLHESHGMV